MGLASRIRDSQRSAAEAAKRYTDAALLEAAAAKRELERGAARGYCAFLFSADCALGLLELVLPS